MTKSVETGLGCLLAIALAGCGGGGGGDGTTPPPPPPADTTLTHAITITAIEGVDTRLGEDIQLTGLPLAGPTITVD